MLCDRNSMGLCQTVEVRAGMCIENQGQCVCHVISRIAVSLVAGSNGCALKRCHQESFWSHAMVRQVRTAPRSGHILA